MIHVEEGKARPYGTISRGAAHGGTKNLSTLIPLLLVESPPSFFTQIQLVPSCCARLAPASRCTSLADKEIAALDTPATLVDIIQDGESRRREARKESLGCFRKLERKTTV